MKSRIIFCFIVLSTLFLAISAISASENITCDNSTLTVADNCEILSEDNRNATEFSAENKVSYADYNDNFAVKLTSNGKGLAGKHVIITLNNVSYIEHEFNQNKSLFPIFFFYYYPTRKNGYA